MGEFWSSLVEKVAISTTTESHNMGSSLVTLPAESAFLMSTFESNKNESCEIAQVALLDDLHTVFIIIKEPRN